MRQMWFSGFLILLLGVGYIGWLALKSSTGVPHLTLMSSGTSAGGELLPNLQRPSADVLLRIHGTNTIGVQLAPALAQAYLKAQGVTNISTRTSGMDELAVIGLLSGKRQVIEIKEHGSATAFRDLATGGCDIGMSARKIQPSEVADFSGLGDMTSPASEHVLGMDGLAIIVNRSNSLSQLSKQDIARIFTGDVKEWKEIGGSGGRIKLFAREAKSGTFETFKSLVLGGNTLSRSAARIEDGRLLSKKVSQEPDAIGFVAFQFVLDSKALAVSENGVKALLPTPLTVSTEDYLLSRRLFLYTAANPTNPSVRHFVDFALSQAGQQVVAANGFVAQYVRALPLSVPADAPPEYKRLTAGAERISLDFRFRPGSVALGNKALPDLDRVRSFLSDPIYKGADIMLFGFTSNTGNQDVDCRLSKDLAQAVSDQFRQRGLSPSTVDGFCSDLPIASNDTEDGREKNRRVEIWVKKH